MLSKGFRVLIVAACLCLVWAGVGLAADSVLLTDVVVVGGGGAGITAALSAAEEGAAVVLLEKMSYMGGATLMSGGIVPAVGTRQQQEAGIEDSIEAFARDILRPAHYAVRHDLVYAVTEHAKDIIEWMEDLGVEWTLITEFLYMGQTNYRMHRAEGAGAGMTQVLIDRVNENEKITVLLETPGIELLADTEGNVVGVLAENSDGERITVIADAVILATSGFAANKDMLEEYIPEIVAAYPMVAPGATGEGIVWGQTLGADTANMRAYQGYAPFSPELRQGLDLFILYRGGILVNFDGERFTNEHLGYSELAPHVVNQPEHQAYMIFDAAVAEATAAFEGYLDAGIVKTAETAAELAEALELPVEQLETVFNDYWDGIERGEDVMNRTHLPASWEAPFHAVLVTGDLRHTQGGLVTDLDGQVLKPDGTMISGLYAAGGVTESFSSAGGPGYMSGNGLLQAFVFGRLAGQAAAEFTK